MNSGMGTFGRRIHPHNLSHARYDFFILLSLFQIIGCLQTHLDFWGAA